MQIIKPNYYDTFRCLASACPDSCCKEWTVQIDPDSAERYQHLPGALGDALRAVMIQEDDDTVLTLTADRRCPMWREDGLCRIQAQMGEDYLCTTCKQFPRLRHDYGDFVELGLELSCPEAARLILQGSTSTIICDIPGGDEPEYDEEAMEILRRTRGEAIAFVNRSDVSIGKTLAILLLYGYAAQEELDGGEAALLEPDKMLRQATSIATGGDITQILAFFRSLEILTPQWQQRLDQPCAAPWDEKIRHLARYFINRYWLQAVSDYDLVGRVKFVILSCLVIKSLGGDLAQTAQLYSKEIENDADNVDAILDGAYTSPALTDIGLLWLLLEE